MNQPPLNPDALEDVAHERYEARRSFEGLPPWEDLLERNRKAEIRALENTVSAYLAAAQPESEDERIPAWQAVANHPAFNDCDEEERPLLESMLDHLTELTAQPVVNSVEELDALPIGSVVIINGTMLQADDRDDYGTMWSRVRDIDAYPSEALALPARVLYRPEVGE